MWGALKKDIGEFVSTVAADATETLESLDQTLDEPLVRRRNNPDEESDDLSHDDNLIDPDTGIPLSSVPQTPKPVTEIPWKSPTEASLDEMKERLVTCEDLFTDDSQDAELEAVEFDVATKTDEISQLLKSDVALQTTFSMLSDAVTYADFWKRYFCLIDNSERLPKTYSVYYQKHLEQRAAEEEASRQASTMGGITSFLGGVVSKLTHEDDEDDDYDNNNYTDTSGVVDESVEEEGPVAAARSALGFLSSTVAGASGRPPFVLNTAVSDDDDDYDDELNRPPSDDDDDSEVELGWDDDDDDDDDDDFDDDDNDDDAIAFQDGDDRSETVDFKDAEKEQLQEQLEQARAERDALQKTVQMQAEELKKNLDVAPAVLPTPSNTSPITENPAFQTDAMETLKLQLFEKDAEMAALRSKIDDGNAEQTDELLAQVDTLKRALQTKDNDFEALKQATQAQTAILEQKLAEQSKHQQQMEELQQSLNARDQELEALKTSANDEASKLQCKIDEKQTEKEEMILALQSQIYALKRQLEEKKDSGDTAQTLEDELRTALASKEAENSMLQTKLDTALAQNEAVKAQLSEQTQETESTNVLQAQLDAKTQEAQASLTEIQALKLQLADKTNEVQAVVGMSKTLETKLEELQSQLTAKSREAEAASGNALTKETKFAELESQLASKTETQNSLEAQLQGLQDELSACRQEGEQKLQQAMDQNAVATKDLESKLSLLERDLATSKAETAQALADNTSLRSELTQLQASLDRPTSPGSNSTGVKVDLDPAPPVMPSTPSAAMALGLEPSENPEEDDDDDDDGWGDDW